MEPDIFAAPAQPTAHSTPGSSFSGTTVTSSLPLVSAAPPESAAAVPAAPAERLQPPPYSHGHTANGHVANGHAGVAVGEFSNGHAVTAASWTVGSTTAAAIPLRRWSDGYPAIDIHHGESLYLRTGKRVLDVVGATAMLIATAPLLALAALCIKVESRGPILFRSTRLGRGGRPFTFYKLRSMEKDAHHKRHHVEHLNEADGPVFKASDDPRVTRVGRLLRRTSVDELPQLLNVLKGEMSLVGPRPPIPEEVERYEPWQLKRLSVHPGLTCLWQISGRSRIGFQEWMRLDLEYIRHRSFWMDLKILVRTIPAVLSRDGAY